MPDQLYTIPALSFLYLASNELTGTISREVGKFTGAKELNYNNNMLTGTIPSDIGKLGSIGKEIVEHISIARDNVCFISRE